MLKFYGMLAAVFILVAVAVYAHRLQQSIVENRVARQAAESGTPVPDASSPHVPAAGLSNSQ
ncbi:hypothetical protein K8R03_01350 [Candidatus Kaiserbacteria bacterium]|nr:hypothetical protein [Candidatus Kaiserbacteria bacterium]